MGKHKNYDINKIKYYWENTYLSINQISQETDISSDMLRYYIKKYNFLRPENLKQLEIESTKNRRKATRLENGNGNYFDNDSIEKMKQTRYMKNNGNYFSSESLEKKKQTNLDKYGVVNVFQNKDIILKSKNTKKEKYGNENYNNRQQAVQSRLKNNDSYFTADMLQKSMQTSLNKFGKEFYTQTEEFKEKSKNTRYIKNNGKYFSKTTIEELQKSARNNYKKSNAQRLKTIENKYNIYQNLFYKNNPKMQEILKNPEKAKILSRFFKT